MSADAPGAGAGRLDAGGLEATGLGVRHGSRVALSGIDLRIVPGEVVAVAGPNGSGKTSLLRALAGLLPHEGHIARDPGLRVGYMPQDNALRAALLVLEVVLLGRLGTLGLRVRAQDVDAAQRAMDELGIAGLAERRIDELSGGQRQMAMLAQVLASEPGIFLLDEPVSALDPRHQLEVLGAVRRLTDARGLATVVVLHDLNAAARHCDRLVVLDGGRIAAAGPPGRVLQASLLAEVFGIEAQLGTAADGRPFALPLRALSPDARPDRR
ncbi:MAG: ABC transporter ATP-binding protein [Alphaproteobacteria bacterium]